MVARNAARLTSSPGGHTSKSTRAFYQPRVHIMPYVLRNIWEQVVSSNEEKAAAKAEAERRGLRWMSSSLVNHPTKPGHILKNTYRMRFAKPVYVAPIVTAPTQEKSIHDPEPARERDHRKKYLQAMAAKGKKALVSYAGSDGKSEWNTI